MLSALDNKKIHSSIVVDSLSKIIRAGANLLANFVFLKAPKSSKCVCFFTYCFQATNVIPFSHFLY